jgi:hypothetical protein
MRYLGLIVALMAAGLAGALATKIHARWTAKCGNVPCGYLQIRLAIIEQMIASHGTAPTYLVIGDSLAEIGRWRAICGREPVVAGIGGARSDTWLPYARMIADALKPDMVVLALGTNDVLTQGRLGPYEQLASSLSDYHLVAVPVHKMPSAPEEAVREANRRIRMAAARTAEQIVAVTTDGVHLTTEDFARWFGAIEKASCGGNQTSDHR